MTNLIAYCGINCGTCPIHLATLEQNKSLQEEMRISIARECTEHYGMNLQPEDINDCDGCKANTGRLFSGCHTCTIRKCAVDKKLETCAFCEEFACNELIAMFKNDPDVRNRLEEIHNSGEGF